MTPAVLWPIQQLGIILQTFIFMHWLDFIPDLFELHACRTASFKLVVNDSSMPSIIVEISLVDDEVCKVDLVSKLAFVTQPLCVLLSVRWFLLPPDHWPPAGQAGWGVP